jgi:ABC-type lipoprotein release transport system permease subunit
MNPLSPFTYIRRHKGRTLMLIGLIALAVTGVYVLVGLFQESFVTPETTINRYLSHFSLVQTDPVTALEAGVTDRIRAHPDVAHVLPQTNVEIGVPNVGGLGFYLRLLGLQEGDMKTVLIQSDVTLAEGRLPEPGTPGVALSREIVTALDLDIGDTFDRSLDDNKFFANYASIVTPLEVVGVLKGDVRLGVMSYDYLDDQEAYQGLTRNGLLVIAQPGREEAVDDFLRQSIQSPRTHVYTHKGVKEAAARSQTTLNAIFMPIILLVTAAVTLVVGAINRLAFIRRLPEFGTLHAVGRSRGWLSRRLTLETTGLAVTGWALGILVAFVAMAALSAAFYVPQGFGFDPVHGPAILLVTPIPLAVIGFTLLTAVRALGRLDPVAIVERGELSLEKAKADRREPRSGQQPRPLAVTTFYRRHVSRAATLIGAMALMIIGTAVIVFIFDAVMDAGQPVLNVLQRVSRVVPKRAPLDEETIARIRAHPAVARAIPTTTVSPMGLLMPLIRDDSPIETYGVTPEDMNTLVTLYGLEMEAGHLPRPGTNEVVIPRTAAKNRNLHVGDVMGDPDHPLYPDAPTLPSPLVVSGVFAPTEDRDGDVWLSLMSQAFVDENQDRWNAMRSLIIVPEVGQKAELDTWLRNTFAGEDHTVFTYRTTKAAITEAMNAGLFAISLMESLVALVAALALAGLNYIFITQRRAEFGVLNALGFNHRQLIWRVIRETLFTTGAAWLVGLLGCATILAFLHYDQYAPLGLRLDFFNLTPWMYTLPVPIAVLLVSGGAVSWALRRLDPVAVIERR